MAAAKELDWDQAPRAASYLDHSALESQYCDEAETVLATVRAFVGQQHWAAHFVHTTGHAADVIAEHAESGRYDLPVMGSHGHSALAGVVRGSVTPPPDQSFP